MSYSCSDFADDVTAAAYAANIKGMPGPDHDERDDAQLDSLPACAAAICDAIEVQLPRHARAQFVIRTFLAFSERAHLERQFPAIEPHLRAFRAALDPIQGSA